MATACRSVNRHTTGYNRRSVQETPRMCLTRRTDMGSAEASCCPDKPRMGIRLVFLYMMVLGLEVEAPRYCILLERAQMRIAIKRSNHARQQEEDIENEQPIERASTTAGLSRVLQPDFRDAASPIYDCFTTSIYDERSDVNWRLRKEKRANQDFLENAQKKFAKAMEVLHSEGITYDPRDPSAWAPHGEHGRLASTAKRAWEHLCLVQEEVDSFDRMLEDSAARQRRDAEKQLLAVLEASGLHNQFMHTARNLANRWRIVGLARTVTYGVRWIRRTLRQTAT